jgi:hypothetical protein
VPEVIDLVLAEANRLAEQPASERADPA